MMRQPIGVGNFYPGEADLLAEEIGACYEGQRGPGALPISTHHDHVRAIIAPNSPYRNCGQCLAWAYRRVAQTPRADVYVILAGNKAPQTTLTIDAFRTPFQDVRVDQELARALIEKGNVRIDPDAHARETSIEVQLPFLQHALGTESEHLKILPLLVGEATDIRALALDLKEAITDAKRNPVFIVSSSLTRYGPLFKFVPFVSEVPKRIQELDDALLSRIKALDADGFRSAIDEQMSAMDGSRCVDLLLRVLRPCTVEVEQVFTSGDVLLDWKNTVTYAAIVFEDKPKTTHGGEPVEFE
jgi:AmmeMemoRadiSam system protein B